MTHTYLKIIEEKDADKVFHLIQTNKERLTRYFPLTIKANEDFEKTVDYLKEATLKTNKKELYPLGIYFNEDLIGMVFIKNIDWRVPKCELGYFIDKSLLTRKTYCQHRITKIAKSRNIECL